jgi:hypothetical protein
LAATPARFSGTPAIGETIDDSVFLPVLWGEMPGRAIRGGATHGQGCIIGQAEPFLNQAGSKLGKDEGRGAMRGHQIRKSAASLLLICGLIGLAACTGGDWRAEAIANAEDKMRGEVNDPTATFKRVQFTGDNSTGQTCGVVRAKAGTGLKAARFIVYIDGAGPFVEAGMGRKSCRSKTSTFSGNTTASTKAIHPKRVAGRLAVYGGLLHSATFLTRALDLSAGGCPG